MRLATITNWAYGATVALTLASGITMLLASLAQERERAAVAQRYRLDQATAEIDEDAAALSRLARQYVITGEAADLAAYQRTAAALGAVEARTRHIRDAGASPDEIRRLHQALGLADALQIPQGQAIALRRNNDAAGAIHILFAPGYARELDGLQSAIERFQYRLDQRTDNIVEDATAIARRWRSVSEVTLALTALLFLCVLYFVFKRRVLKPVVTLSDVVGRLAAQDYDAEPPNLDQVDEIGDMAQALRVFRENGIERQRLERERDGDRAVRDLLSRMTQRMQSCDTIDDLKDVVRCFTPEVMPHLAGKLYLIDDPRQTMVEACAWGAPLPSSANFPVQSCWGLRRGAPHERSDGRTDVPCPHVETADKPERQSLCLPLTGQQGMLGLLYFERREAADSPLSSPYAQMVGENVTLALDNLRLRDALRTMAMTDPLTGLANRRQLEIRIATMLRDAASGQSEVACAMVDIDHFKRFNDEHGHDAGDAVLRAVGATLANAVRDRASVFRVGGEEFVILFSGVSAAGAAARAEDIRARIGALRVTHEGRELGAITASLGLASAPEHCDPDRLLATADATLLRAKKAGRDRMLIAAPRRRQRAAA